VLHRPSRISFIDEARVIEPPDVLAYRLLIALQLLNDIFLNDLGAARDQEQNLNASVIRNSFEVSLQLPRTFCFCTHTYILAYTWVYEYVVNVDKSVDGNCGYFDLAGKARSLRNLSQAFMLPVFIERPENELPRRRADGVSVGRVELQNRRNVCWCNWR